MPHPNLDDYPFPISESSDDPTPDEITDPQSPDFVEPFVLTHKQPSKNLIEGLGQ